MATLAASDATLIEREVSLRRPDLGDYLPDGGRVIDLVRMHGPAVIEEINLALGDRCAPVPAGELADDVRMLVALGVLARIATDLYLNLDNAQSDVVDLLRADYQTKLDALSRGRGELASLRPATALVGPQTASEPRQMTTDTTLARTSGVRDLNAIWGP